MPTICEAIKTEISKLVLTMQFWDKKSLKIPK
jgi:hypothetical protein